MLWLYWRRVRLPVIVAAAVLGALAALVVLAGALGGAALNPVAARSATNGPRSGPGTEPVVSAPAARQGLRLMSAAVAACQAVTYHGVQFVAWSDAGGARSYVVRVWHRPGAPELAEDDDDADIDEPSGSDQPGAAPGSDAPVGVLSVSPWMFRLLRANYSIEYAGPSTSSGRSAMIVVMRRRDGSLAARFWLDRKTSLPLRRELFDGHGLKVSEGAFIDLQIGGIGTGLQPLARTQAWNAQPGVLAAARLRASGWTVPTSIAGNLALVSITRTATRTGAVVDASYSDGLSVVSVFMQRGDLPQALNGWRQSRIAGRQVWLTMPTTLGERGVAWSAGGFVYTVIADAPSTVVTEVIGEFPHDSDGGLWQRVGRGLERIGSWFNPFS